MKALARCWSLGMLLSLPLSAPAEEDVSPTVSLKRLTLDTATAIAKGAIASCREKGIQCGVSVVDRDGTVQAMLRDTVAPPITLTISRQKAFTAVNFGVPTSKLGGLANTSIGRVDGLVMVAGGVPVQAGGQTLGGVGVSGAPSGKSDEECAQAGIDAVLEDLEMATE